MKKILWVILAVVALIVMALVFGRNILAKTIVINGVKQACGLKVDIVRVDISLPKVAVIGLKIYNPEGFNADILADIPEVSFDLELQEFFKNKIHFKKLTLNVREMNVILNEQGKLNVNSLGLLLPPKTGGTPPEVKIDMLSVKIGKVGYRGSFPGAGITSGEFNLNVDETFRDVTDPSKVTGQIMQKVISKVGVGSFSTFAAEGGIKGVVEGLKGLFGSK
jgi:hypothetical protein